MAFMKRKIGDGMKWDDLNVTTFNFHYTFVIKDFSWLDGRSRIMMHSPTFDGDLKYGDQWRVKFGHHSKDLAKITLQLLRTNSKEEEVDTLFQICLLDQKGIAWAGTVKKETFVGNPEDEVHHELMYISTVTDPKNGYLVDDSLNFYVQISTRRLKTELKTEPETEKNLSHAEQLKSFLINENFADVVLTNANNKFPASKIILAAQSPVFFSMFNSEMLESKPNDVVNIEDFSDDVIKGFLEFIYTGETKSLTENTVELLKFSDKYQVQNLKDKCEKILWCNLNIGNAVEMLILSYLHSPQNLKPKIISFVNENIADLKETESFEQMKKEHPQVFIDLYEDANRKDVKWQIKQDE